MFLDLMQSEQVSCGDCGATFRKKSGDTYRLSSIVKKQYPNWDRYKYQTLSTAEWIRISQGGYSNEDQRQFDIEFWLNSFAQGKVSLKPKSSGNVVLSKNESDLFTWASIDLLEPQKVRKTSGMYGGPTVRIAKGLSLKIGGFRANSESSDELETLDTGQLSLTNQRLIFTGKQQTRVIPLSRIITITPYEDGVSVSLDKPSHNYYFLNVDKTQITIHVQDRVYTIPFNGVLLKLLLERAISNL